MVVLALEITAEDQRLLPLGVVTLSILYGKSFVVLFFFAQLEPLEVRDHILYSLSYLKKKNIYFTFLSWNSIYFLKRMPYLEKSPFRTKNKSVTKSHKKLLGGKKVPVRGILESISID